MIGMIGPGLPGPERYDDILNTRPQLTDESDEDSDEYHVSLPKNANLNKVKAIHAVGRAYIKQGIRLAREAASFNDIQSRPSGGRSSGGSTLDSHGVSGTSVDARAAHGAVNHGVERGQGELDTQTSLNKASSLAMTGDDGSDQGGSGSDVAMGDDDDAALDAALEEIADPEFLGLL